MGSLQGRYPLFLDQNIVWNAEYEPFGKANITTETVTNNTRFPGQYYDQETGLYYNYFRYYDPSIGRYITSDPIGLAGGINTYGYVAQNPLRYTDPQGLEVTWEDLGRAAGRGAGRGRALGGWGAAIGVAIGVGIYLYDDLTSDDDASDDPKQCEDKDDDDNCDLEFVRETRSFDGKTKSCIYRRKGVIITFPQAIGHPCPPINRKRCLVDTSFIMPPARY